MTPAAHVSAADAAALRQYLSNLADTLQNIVVPEVQGRALDRTRECVKVLARLAVGLTPPDESAAPGLDDAAAAAAHAGAALEAEQAEFVALLNSLAPNTAAGQRRFDQDRLQAWLRTHPAASPALRITEATPLPGGRSKLTVLVRQSGCESLPERFILRQDWASSVTGASVVPEFEILKRVHAAGIRVAKPLLLESGTEALSAPFLIVSCVDGKGEGDLFDPPPSEHMARQLAQQLGQLHAMTAAPFVGLPGVVERAYGEEALRAELESFRKVIAQFGEPCTTMDVAVDWLDRHVPKIEGPRLLVHGDLGFHNFLVHQGELTAVLDWELAHLGNPAEDLGYVRSWVEKMLPWDRFLSAYHEAGGPVSNALAIDFYTLWAGVRLYFLLLQARAAIVSGMLRDSEITYTCVHLTQVLLLRMSRELRAILARS